MKKIITILLIGAIALIALHDFYVDQYDSHTMQVKKEMHCNHFHHADYHIAALLPQMNSFFEEEHAANEFFLTFTLLQPTFTINPPPPRF